jgi:beta-xylosidase
LITSLKIWNEPNNLSHWDFQLDPDWRIFAEMLRLTGSAVRAHSDVPLVLGGISPIDVRFLRLLASHGALDAIDVLAVHGFPLDWNLWPLEEWPERIEEIRAEFGRPVWVTETGVSSYASEEVAAWGLRRSLAALRGERVYWYTLVDLAPDREATTRHKQAEGSSYFRHFHFGLLRHDGTPKLAVRAFEPGFGICQWLHHGDEPTLALTVDWLERLGVTHVRTGLSWAESSLPGAWDWFDTVMDALAPYDVCATLCFTPPSRGLRPDHTSPPVDPAEFAEFATRVVHRYLLPSAERLSAQK